MQTLPETDASPPPSGLSKGSPQLPVKTWACPLQAGEPPEPGGLLGGRLLYSLAGSGAVFPKRDS